MQFYHTPREDRDSTEPKEPSASRLWQRGAAAGPSGFWACGATGASFPRKVVGRLCLASPGQLRALSIGPISPLHLVHVCSGYSRLLALRCVELPHARQRLK